LALLPLNLIRKNNFNIMIKVSNKEQSNNANVLLSAVRLSKAEQLDLILSAIGNDWMTYKQIHQKLKGKISVAGISKTIWDNIDKIKNKIDWDAEIYGAKEWQIRMRFKVREPNCA
jgi:hypothetical protein